MTVVFVFHLNLLFFGEHTVFFCFDFVRCSLILFIYLLYRICSCVFFLFSRISHFFACFFLAQYYYYYYFRCIFLSNVCLLSFYFYGGCCFFLLVWFSYFICFKGALCFITCYLYFKFCSFLFFFFLPIFSAS